MVEVLVNTVDSIISTPSSGAGREGQALQTAALGQGMDSAVELSDQYNLYQAEVALEEAKDPILQQATALTTKNTKIQAGTTGAVSGAALLQYTTRMNKLANTTKNPSIAAKIRAMETGSLKYDPQMSAGYAELKARNDMTAKMVVEGTELALANGEGVVSTDRALELWVADAKEDKILEDAEVEARMLEAASKSAGSKQKNRITHVLVRGNIDRRNNNKRFRKLLSLNLEDGKKTLESVGVDASSIQNIKQYQTSIRELYIRSIDQMMDNVKDNALTNLGTVDYAAASSQIDTFLKQGEALKKSMSNDEVFKLYADSGKGYIAQQSINLLSNDNIAYLFSVIANDSQGWLAKTTQGKLLVSELKQYFNKIVEGNTIPGQLPSLVSTALGVKETELMEQLNRSMIKAVLNPNTSPEDKDKLIKAVEERNAQVVMSRKPLSVPDVVAVLESGDVEVDVSRREDQNKSLRKVMDQRIIPEMESIWNTTVKTNTGVFGDFVSLFSIAKAGDKETTDVNSVILISVTKDGSPIFTLKELTPEQEESKEELEDYVSTLNKGGKRLAAATRGIARNLNQTPEEAMATLLGKKFGLGKKKAPDKPKDEKPYIIFKP